jgi:NAD(P)-dependent dehydrogenase (short-subunit alcohol dehydrogenase family)
MSHDFSLIGKVAIVTGAAGDIGAASVRLLARRGAKVLAVDRDAAGLTRLTPELAADAEVATFCADVTDESAVEAYVRAAVERFGGLDIFFNNAGIEGDTENAWRLTSEFPLASFNQTMAVNVGGVFLGMKHTIPALQARGGGSIINSCSLYGIKGSAGQIAYVASKHAVLGMTKTVAAEVGKDGIRVNCIGPALVEGRMMDELMRQISARNPGATPPAVPTTSAAPRPAPFAPLRRWASPDEIAPLVAFLASDDSAFMTGAYYAIDGGLGAV